MPERTLLLPIRVQPYALLQGDWIAQPIANADANDGTQDAAFNQLHLAATPEQLEFLPEDWGVVEVPLLGGRTKTYRVGPHRKRLRLRLGGLSAADVVKLDWMLRSGRPWAVGAWFDSSTHWMSHFGGLGTENSSFEGLGEVGDTDFDQVVRRDSGASYAEYLPSPLAGENQLRQLGLNSLGHKRPKIVPGMIGSAIQLDPIRSGGNIAAARKNQGGTNIWSVTGGGALNQRHFSTSVPLGAGNSNHVNLPKASGSPAADYVETGTQTVTNGLGSVASVWARGSGSIRLGWFEAGTLKTETSAVTLTHDWQRVVLYFTPTAGTGTLRVYSGSTTAGALAQLAMCQIEKGDTYSSFMDHATTHTVSDAVYISDVLNTSAGFTMVWWVKWRYDGETKCLFSLVMSGGSDVWAELLWPGPKARFYYNGSGNYVEQDLSGQGLVDGQWVQLALVVLNGGNGGTGPRLTALWYCNGSQLTSQDVASAQGFYPGTSNSGIYLGADAGRGVPLGKALCMPLDAFRLDERPWTAAEVLEDYQLRTDPGVQSVLAQLQGRYFRPSINRAPHGPFLDIQNVTIDLVEIDTRRQSVY